MELACFSQPAVVVPTGSSSYAMLPPATNSHISSRHCLAPLRKAAKKHYPAPVQRLARRDLSLTCYKTGDEGTGEPSSSVSLPLNKHVRSSRGRRLITEDTGVILLNNRLPHSGTSPVSDCSDRTILERTWLRRDSSDLDCHDDVNAILSSSNVGVLSRRGNVSEASFQRGFGTDHVGYRTHSRNRPEKTVQFDIGKAISQMLPWAVLATAASALIHPPSFSWFTKQYYAPALGGIMLSIGLQLSPKDFATSLQRPLPALLGLTIQYLLKPLIAAVICAAFRIPPAFSAGFLLVACVGGAQLSSYASFLGDADVALSIVVTSLSTFASVALTPPLSALLLGAALPVDMLAMATSILQVVVLPVSLGLILNTYARPLVDCIRPLLPLLAMVCTSLCIGSPLAFSRNLLLSPHGMLLFAPVLCFHLLSFAAGYWVSKLPALRCEERACRTLSLCGGMQSSTLAMLLASQFLGISHAVPAALSVVIMSLTGLSLGAFWGSGRRLRDMCLPTEVHSQAQLAS